MHPDAALATRRLEAGATIVQAQPWRMTPVTLASPAAEVMTDLTQVKAASCGPSMSLREAEQVMIWQGVRMLFVVSEVPAVEGLITTTDLRGDRALRVVQERRIRHDDLTVADVMTPREMLDAIAFAGLRSACVGNLVATLKRHGRNHLLVAEAGQVRGVISRAQIERQLGKPIDIVEIAGSFAEIEKMLV